jgi:hypothetical protein
MTARLPTGRMVPDERIELQTFGLQNPQRVIYAPYGRGFLANQNAIQPLQATDFCLP